MGTTWTMEYPRARVAEGPKAETRARSDSTWRVSRSTMTSISRRMVARVRSISSRRVRMGVMGSAMTGRERILSRPRRSLSTQPRKAAAIRERASAITARSSATEGTTRFAASVGVAARRSATLSSTGLSGSWPMAETTGVPAAATARCSASSEKGSRSSTEPPPRAMMMTSTSGSASSCWRASITSGTVFAP